MDIYISIGILAQSLRSRPSIAHPESWEWQRAARFDDNLAIYEDGGRASWRIDQDSLTFCIHFCLSSNPKHQRTLGQRVRQQLSNVTNVTVIIHIIDSNNVPVGTE